MRLLLHVCCAPCSIQCVESLAGEDIKPDIFWFNPNIHPYTEFCSRRDSLFLFAKEKGIAVIDEDVYGLRLFINGLFSSGHEDVLGSDAQLRCAAQLRCPYCYRLRLEKTAMAALEKGYDAFSTTLLISPYQNHELLKEIGEEVSKSHSIEFFYRDFRPRFRDGQRQAREAGYYMQKYCGCIFSEEERYVQQHMLKQVNSSL